MTATTMSLADVARLARVQRPAVSMWRSRRVAGVPFPAPQADGRFLADDVVSYLHATGRGNNPEPELAADITTVSSPTCDPTTRRDLLALLAARCALGDDALAGEDPEDLLDDVETLDPDDEWLFSEVEDADIDRLAPLADAIADNSYSTVDAYEQLLARDRGAGDLSEALVATLADCAANLLGEAGTLVDVEATATDVVLALTRDEDRDAAPVLVPISSTEPTTGIRGCLRRYRVHSLNAATAGTQDAWDLPDGSVILARIASSASVAEAMAAIDDLSLQMDPSASALIIGPASALIDELPADQVGARDVFLREGRVLAAVGLPQGLLRDGGGEHLGLWLMGPGDPRHLWAGDLSSTGFGPATRQQLLDDLLACRDVPSHHSGRHRAFALLHRADTTRLLARSLALTGLDVSPSDPFPLSAADDAARMAELLIRLAEPLDDPFAGTRPAATGQGSPGYSTLGDLCRQRLVTAISGNRLGELPAGALRLWTAEAVAARAPEGVDLLALTTGYPDARLTEPGDVVFTGSGAPHAVVDAAGGSAVARPARILRISPTASLSPRAIANTINALHPAPGPTGSGSWRSWRVPVVPDSGSRRDAEAALSRVDAWEDQIRTRLSLVDELRTLATRSVTSGALSFVPVDDQTRRPKGQ